MTSIFSFSLSFSIYRPYSPAIAGHGNRSLHTRGHAEVILMVWIHETEITDPNMVIIVIREPRLQL